MLSDGEGPAKESASEAGGTLAQPIVEWQPTTGASDAPSPPRVADGAAIRLWQPRDVLIPSFLLGFPGGFGLVARNAWRMGRRRTALLHLLAGAAILLLILFLPIPRALGVALNFGIACALFALARRQVVAVEAGGGRVERAPGLAGVATFLGGWVAVAAPAIAVVLALSFLGGQVRSVLAGTMEFGASGTGCQVGSAATTLPAAGPVHYVAYLSREVRAGETVTLTLSEQAQGQIGTSEMAVASSADCVSGTIPGGTLSAGTYSFDLKVGTEGVSGGRLVLSP